MCLETFASIQLFPSPLQKLQLTMSDQAQTMSSRTREMKLNNQGKRSIGGKVGVQWLPGWESYCTALRVGEEDSHRRYPSWPCITNQLSLIRSRYYYTASGGGNRRPLTKQGSFGSRVMNTMRRRSQAGIQGLTRLRRQSQSMRWRVRADTLNRRVSDNEGKLMGRALAVIQKFSVRFKPRALPHAASTITYYKCLRM